MKLDRKYALSLTLIVAGIFVLYYVSSLTTVSHASWAYYYRDIKELTEASDIVIIGHVKSSKLVLIEPDIHSVLDPFTDYKIEVTQVLKGDITDGCVIVSQTGGTFLGVKNEISDDPLLKKGTTMILFLREWDYNRYCIRGGPQGRFEVHDDKIYSIGEVNGQARVTTEHLLMNGISLEEFIV